MADDDVTLGELARQMSGLAGSVDRMGKKVDGLSEKIAGEGEKRAADFVRLGYLERAVKDLDDWQTWAQRLVLGGVILAVLALVLPL